MSGTLYLVATPIGNLEDITLRAVRILKEVDLIAAEDTRHTLKLLNHLEISKPMISYHRHNEDVKTVGLIQLLEEGKNIALVTDAGTPAISDPGEEIVKEAIKQDIVIVPIPGACALINALIPSGFSTKEFIFYGFLPLNKKLRKEKLNDMKKQNKTMILYEAPHKILNTLQDIKKELGNVEVVLARELTKIHEEFLREKIDILIQKINEPRGEYILLIQNNEENILNEEKSELDDMNEEEQYQYYEKLGKTKKDIIKQIAKNKKVPKDEIYKKFIKK